MPTRKPVLPKVLYLMTVNIGHLRGGSQVSLGELFRGAKRWHIENQTLNTTCGLG